MYLSPVMSATDDEINLTAVLTNALCCFLSFLFLRGRVGTPSSEKIFTALGQSQHQLNLGSCWICSLFLWLNAFDNFP